MGSMSRNKGKRAEREVIGLLNAICVEVYSAHKLDPPLLQRNLQQSDGGGFDITGLEWLALEVKHAELLRLPEWWKQTLAQCGREQLPVLIYRQNRTPWRVRMFVHMHTGNELRCLPATVDMVEFLDWFRRRLNWQLSQLGERLNVYKSIGR